MDTLGLLITVVVHSAGLQDRDGAKLVVSKIRHWLPKLQLIWVDSAYAGKLIVWVKEVAGITLQVVKRTDTAKGFKPLPKRWIVERTFGWLNKYRRLSKDFEGKPETTEAWIRLAMIHLMVRRLCPGGF